jgi:hypothetical protein
VIRWLASLLRAPVPRSIEDPVLGTMVMEHGQERLYWVNEAWGPNALVVEVGSGDGAPPSEEQAAFFLAIVSDWDAMFQRVSRQLAARYSERVRSELPEQWKSVLAPAAVSVPSGADALQPWSVSFECTLAGLGFGDIYICHFVQGVLHAVTVDS